MYLTGVTNDRDEPTLIAHGVGLMVQPGNSYHLRVGRFPFYAADNGCFADKWVEDAHLAWLDRLTRDRCLFAVSPDVYPDAAESLARGLSYAPLLREMGFPVAVVAQDGAEALTWPWDELDVLFIGGARTPNPRHEWKLSAAAADLAGRARAAGKWVHMGRVNSIAPHGTGAADGQRGGRLARVARRQPSAARVHEVRVAEPADPQGGASCVTSRTRPVLTVSRLATRVLSGLSVTDFLCSVTWGECRPGLPACHASQATSASTAILSHVCRLGAVLYGGEQRLDGTNGGGG